MARRYTDNDIAFGHMSFLDVLANSVGALTFLFLMFFVITSALVTPAKFRLLTDTLPDAIAGKDYSINLAAIGGTQPYKWKITEGTLPPGLRLDPHQGAISGASTQEGAYRFKVRVAESGKGKTGALERELGVRITPQSIAADAGGMALRINTDKLASAVVGSPYSVTLAAIGGKQPYSWSVGGELPPGLALEGDKIVGVPRTSGNWRFEVSAADKQSAVAAQPVDISIKSTPILTEADLKPVAVMTKEPPAARVDNPYELILAANGGVPPYTWSVANSRLPAGLMLDPKTGVISGTPEQAQAAGFSVVARDSRGAVSGKTELTMAVDPAETKIADDGLPLVWWLIIPATIGTTLGLIFLAGIVIGVQCPWDKSWGCKVVGKDAEGHNIYACKHGHRFVNQVRQIREEVAGQ